MEISFFFFFFSSQGDQHNQILQNNDIGIIIIIFKLALIFRIHPHLELSVFFNSLQFPLLFFKIQKTDMEYISDCTYLWLKSWI